ncbi:hypothetical protein DPMN_011271 [Dreissena polymorpha]|uniref:Uncharacterized protein n=1 Tax=Dreissena polymorpha TaxID=45954 RepID=A0A9D4N1F1_DREPO|nr:hypothetical protein DPMN_011271 [Dreissena polymorpha]
MGSGYFLCNTEVHNDDETIDSYRRENGHIGNGQNSHHETVRCTHDFAEIPKPLKAGYDNEGESYNDHDQITP